MNLIKILRFSSNLKADNLVSQWKERMGTISWMNLLSSSADCIQLKRYQLHATIKRWGARWDNAWRMCTNYLNPQLSTSKYF